MKRLLPSRLRNTEKQADFIHQKMIEQTLNKFVKEKPGVKLGGVSGSKQEKRITRLWIKIKKSFR